MEVSSSKHQAVPSRPEHQVLPPLDEMGKVVHNLMGSISALLMCERLLAKELAPTEELASNPTLATTLVLLKETADQIRDYGVDLSRLSEQRLRSGSCGLPET